MCKFMSTNLKFTREIRADGEGKLARLRNIKSVTFHALPDSEIYTTGDGSYSEGGSYNQSYDDVLNPVS